MKLPSWAPRIGQAIVAADAVILSALVDQKVISALTATDIGGVIAALAVGWHGANVVQAVKANNATPAAPVIAPATPLA